MKKKAQMKMMENMGIMFIFFILVALGFIFYGKLSGHSTTQEISKFSEIRAVKLAQKVAVLPEVRCSEENIKVEDCFDLLRAEEASLVIKDNYRYYLDLLSYSKIVLREYYPEVKEVVFYEEEPNNWTDLIPIQTPISLYDASEDKYYFGVLEVGMYEKK